jgi:hypothetical protein
VLPRCAHVVCNQLLKLDHVVDKRGFIVSQKLSLRHVTHELLSLRCVDHICTSGHQMAW